MTDDFDILKDLGITIQDGFIKTATETIRLQDIKRIEIKRRPTILGYLIALTQFSEVKVSLIAHGDFGEVVLCGYETYCFLHAGDRGKSVIEVFGLAKEAIEAALVESQY